MKKQIKGSVRMTKKVIIFLSIFLLSFAVTLLIIKEYSKVISEKKQKIEEPKILISDKVVDDCIENSSTEANSTEEKVSPNALLIIKKYYKECRHTINEYVEIPKELVNLTQEEVQKEYFDWEVIGFSSSEITLYKEFEGKCGEHYMIKNESGKIIIYKISEKGIQTLFKKTDISTEFLTQTDLIKIENGFEVYSQEELNKVLEDYE